jgi:preprotein translocase subunit SecD
MDRGWWFRLVIVLGAIGLSAYLLYPSYVYYTQATPEQRENNELFCKSLPAWATCKKLTLGLDLQGGLHLVMGVEVEKAVEHRVDRLADSLRDGLKEENLAFSRLDRPRNTSQIVLQMAPTTDIDAVEKYIRRQFSVLQTAKKVDDTLTLEMVPAEADAVKSSAVEQAIKTIRNRADKLGVSEPTIAKRGTDNILIQLPGIKDPAYAIDIIGRTAQLEFQIVDEEGTAAWSDLPDAPIEGVTKKSANVEGKNGRSVREIYFELPAGQKDAVRALLEPKIPSNREVAFGPVMNAMGAEVKDTLRTYLLDAKPGITGDYLTDARVDQDRDLMSQYYVSMSFDPKGAKIFADLTEANVDRRMAIVLDDSVNSAPVIQEKIGGGNARITLGRGTDAHSSFEEAKALSLVLKAGALPAPVEVREQRTVGKSLGESSVNAGRNASLIGAVLVVLFMLIYYRWSGLLADFAVILNVVIVMALMALLDATLTLPGMAGLALMMGMSVDANVIICERIREELRIGKTPRAAIEAGYNKAWATIFDSNLTTIIAAIVMMQYGSGSVRGFGVTLTIGITASMFTAIVVTRLVYDLFTSKRRLQTLSI